jgi:hypothetical protein
VWPTDAELCWLAKMPAYRQINDLTVLHEPFARVVGEIHIARIDRCGESPLMKWQTQLFERLGEPRGRPASQDHNDYCFPDLDMAAAIAELNIAVR